jgi:hypothetical protein
MKPPPVPAVDRRRRQPAPVTSRLHRAGRRRDQDRVFKILDLIDMEVAQMREEQAETAGFLACRECCTTILAAAR